MDDPRGRFRQGWRLPYQIRRRSAAAKGATAMRSLSEQGAQGIRDNQRLGGVLVASSFRSLGGLLPQRYALIKGRADAMPVLARFDWQAFFGMQHAVREDCAFSPAFWRLRRRRIPVACSDGDRGDTRTEDSERAHFSLYSGRVCNIMLARPTYDPIACCSLMASR